MKKTYKLEGELCASCAGRIQAAIEKEPGVNGASVNALTYRFTLDADDAAFDNALAKAITVFDDIEPDCEVVVGR